MYEKLSNEPKRRIKVSKLKKKILEEIKKELDIYKRVIGETNSDDVFFDLVRRGFVLLELQRYIENKNTFMRQYANFEYDDIVIYIVSEKSLNIFLQDDYHFVFKFLLNAEENDWNVFKMLDDQYFEHEFISIIDSILYDKKQEGIA